MRKYKIFKWFHYSNFIPCIHKLENVNVFEKKFAFTDSCRYKIDEKSCVNKLFGFSFGLFGVHKESARFGWTYHEETDAITIWRYTYKNGKLTKKPICDYPIDENEIHEFALMTHVYDFSQLTAVSLIIDGKLVYTTDFKTTKKYILTLGPYFGGNTRAPHTITILHE